MTSQTMESNQKMRKNKLPGPSKLMLYGLAPMAKYYPLETFRFMHQTWGDIVNAPWWNREIIFINNPQYLQHILRTNHTNYTKGFEYKFMRPLLGNGLLMSEGDQWRKKRKIVAQEFHQKRVDNFVPLMENLVNKMLSEWSEKPSFSIEMSEVMMSITFQIACEIFFGSSKKELTNLAKESLEVEVKRSSDKIHSMIAIPDFIPTPENRKGKKAIANLEFIIKELMANNDNKKEQVNILSRLMNFRDGDNNPLSSIEIRDELMTLMLAGHETTSNALMWTFYYLALNKHYQKKIQEEIRSLDLNNLKAESLDKFVFTKACFLESMRLSPPVPGVSRKAKEDDMIGGHFIPAGSTVVCSIHALHRDSRYWDNPSAFKPERFVGREMKADDYTFIPFAKGPRSCIGERMAMLEGILILVKILSQYEVSLESGFTPKPEHSITLRSGNGMRLVLEKIL